MSTTPVTMSQAIANNYVLKHVFRIAMSNSDDSDPAGPDYGSVIADAVARSQSGLSQFDAPPSAPATAPAPAAKP